MSKLKLKTLHFVDIYELSNILEQKHNIKDDNLPNAAHKELGDLLEVDYNGFYRQFNFLDLSKRAKNKTTEKVLKLYDLETKHLQDKDGYIWVHYSW